MGNCQQNETEKAPTRDRGGPYMLDRLAANLRWDA